MSEHPPKSESGGEPGDRKPFDRYEVVCCAEAADGKPKRYTLYGLRGRQRVQLDWLYLRDIAEETAYQRGREDGAREMRERAAREAETIVKAATETVAEFIDKGQLAICRGLYASVRYAIEALPLTEAPEPPGAEKPLHARLFCGFGNCIGASTYRFYEGLDGKEPALLPNLPAPSPPTAEERKLHPVCDQYGCQNDARLADQRRLEEERAVLLACREQLRPLEAELARLDRDLEQMQSRHRLKRIFSLEAELADARLSPERLERVADALKESLGVRDGLSYRETFLTILQREFGLDPKAGKRE